MVAFKICKKNFKGPQSHFSDAVHGVKASRVILLQPFIPDKVVRVILATPFMVRGAEGQFAPFFTLGQ